MFILLYNVLLRVKRAVDYYRMTRRVRVGLDSSSCQAEGGEEGQSWSRIFGQSNELVKGIPFAGVSERGYEVIVEGTQD